MYQSILLFFASIGLKKKLLEIAKLSPFRKLAKWVRAITNHLYYTVKSTEAETEDRQQHWLSVWNHIQGIHHHPELPLYPVCEHDDLPARFVDEETGKNMIRYYINPGKRCCMYNMLRK